MPAALMLGWLEYDQDPSATPSALCGAAHLLVGNNAAIPSQPTCHHHHPVLLRDWVKNGRDVSSKEVSLAEAKAIKGLRAVFGEVRPADVNPYTMSLQLPAVHAVDLTFKYALQASACAEAFDVVQWLALSLLICRCTLTPCVWWPLASLLSSCWQHRMQRTTCSQVWSSVEAHTSPTPPRYGTHICKHDHHWCLVGSMSAAGPFLA